jgi:hypothetical protein
MEKARFRMPLMIAVATLLASSCASSGGAAPSSAGAGAGRMTIQVTNDMVPPSAVTIWIRPEAGGRTRLGTIQPNGQQTFSFAPISTATDHRLEAEFEGRTIVSNPFNFQGATSARWRVKTPLVTVER